MAQSQEALLQTRKASRHDDYLGLFGDNIWPTRDIEVLERGGHVLIIKSYDFGRKIMPSHRRIWKLLVQHGEVLDAPGSITVVCVWGLGPAVARDLVIFDHTGESAQRLDLDGWKAFLLDWWRNHKGGR